MTPDLPTIDETEEPEAVAGIPSEPSMRGVVTLEDAIAASLQGDLRAADEATLPPEEPTGLPAQLADRGIDLGSLLGTVITASSQAKPKPAAGNKEDPAALLGKLAESLGISPAELLKRLGPALQEMLNGPGSKPRRRPKPDSAKPAAKPKPRPASKPKPDSAKPAAKSKPKPASKPKPDSAKPAAKPKPKTTNKP
jgi:hypothetical protein